MLVAAIDFGTTFSGWAYSFKHEFESDPLKITAKRWNSGHFLSSKCPTSVLIQPDGKTLASFGYDAEEQYASLVEKGENKRWFFYKHFKMFLYGQIGIRKDALIPDVSGKSLPVKTVFSLAILFLKTDLMKMSKNRLEDGNITDSDVHWVLTVPAIWNDSAKQFMREAAKEAGIPGNKLTIALEPEAASLLCRHLPVSNSHGKQTPSLASVSIGTKYMLLDAGGGTVDITIHQILRDGNLKEIYKASGGAWGGTKVDDAFWQFIVKLVDKRVIKKFREKHIEDYFAMFRDFEQKKRKIAPSKQYSVTFRIPASLTELFKKTTGKSLVKHVQQTSFANLATMKDDKLRVNANVVKQLFEPSVFSILDHVINLLRKPEVYGCDVIVMVGGFSESPMLQENVQRTFPNMTIIVPDEAGLAVLKGAVIYGHSSRLITHRICKYTYGTATGHFKSWFCQHPAGRTKTFAKGSILCMDIFSQHVMVGQSVHVDEEQRERIYTLAHDNQSSIRFDVFASSFHDPIFVTDRECRQIGTVSIPLTNMTGGKHRQIGVSMKFGGTEIEVKVVDKTTGYVKNIFVDFLG